MRLKWLKLHKHATKVALPAFVELPLNNMRTVGSGVSAGDYCSIVNDSVAGIMVLL